MPKIKLGEDIFEVDQENLDIFLAETPEAEIFTDEITDPEEGKTNGVADEGATAMPETGPAPESTESDSVGSLLDTPKVDPLPKTYDEFRSINETELTNIESNQQFQDLLMDLSRDTGSSKFTKKEAEGGIKGWFKKYYDILTPNAQLGKDLGSLEKEEATEVLDLDYTQEQINIFSYPP